MYFAYMAAHFESFLRFMPMFACWKCKVIAKILRTLVIFKEL